MQEKITVRPVRIGSKGLRGTEARSRHHAKILLPFIESMKGAVKHLGFVEWVEGETVHVFESSDGRRFSLRGATEADVGYVGVKLSLRLSRTVEHPLIIVRDVSEMPALLQTMRLLAVPHVLPDPEIEEEHEEA